MHTHFELAIAAITALVVYFAVVHREYIDDKLNKSACRRGKHHFKRRKYHCSRCKAPRAEPALRCLQGGKKDMPIFPRF